MTTSTAPKGGYDTSITLPHTESLELWNNCFSGCSQKVRICLAEAKLKYKNNHIHLIETGWYQTCSPDFKKINPGATVPVLVHDGHPVYESHEQIHYVDEKFLGGQLCPKDKKEEVEHWTDFVSIRGDIMAKDSREARIGSCSVLLTLPIFGSMCQDIPYRKIWWGLLHHPNKERPIMFTLLKLLGPYAVKLAPFRKLVRAGCKCCRKHLETIEQTLSDGREFICGAQYTLADVGLTATFTRLMHGNFDFLYADLPYVCKYWARLRARQSFHDAITAKELPIMTMAFARIKFWKEKYSWYKDALETDQPVGLFARSRV